MFDQFPLILAQEGEAPVGGDNDNAGSQTVDTITNGTKQADLPQNTNKEAPGLLDSLGPMLPIFLILGVFMIFMMRSQGKEKKKRAALLAALTKGDKVQTVGGILGTVIEIRDNEVLVKVDENANTRMRFARSAIQSITSSND